jgi:antitoxin component of MazEF toxin-antitoxin module
MRLQKQLSRKVGEKEYPKYVMTIPPNCVERLGWQQGVNLEVIVKDNKLIVQPRQNKDNQEE